MGDLDDVTLVVLVVQEIGHVAGVSCGRGLGGGQALLLLDADAVVLLRVAVAERVLAGLQALQLRDVDQDGDVLAGLEGWQRLAIDRGEVEGGDLLGLLDLVGDLELAPVGPALGLLVDLLLAADHDIGELPVRDAPGFLDLRGERVAENLTHGLDEVLADDLVLVRLDVERRMLVADQLHGGTQSAQVVDVGGIGEEGAGQGPLLVAIALIGDVEDVVQLGMGSEHVLVEHFCDGGAMFNQDRHGGLDELDLAG